MRITIGEPNNVYTAVFDITTGVGTLTFSGVQGFDMTDSMLDSVYDTTINEFFNCKRVTVTYSYVEGVPVWVYTFYSLPAGTAEGDTLIISIDVPDVYANTAILQYTASITA